MKKVARHFHLILLFFLIITVGSCGLLTKLKEGAQSDQLSLQGQNKLYRVAWAKNMDPPYQSGNLPISFNSPLIHEGLLFMGNSTGQFTAYNAENGREVWSVKDSGLAIVGQPGIYKEQVLYGNEDGRVFARNYFTGKLLYKVDLGGRATEAPPIFYKDRAIFNLRSHEVVCIDASTGKILWNYKRNVSHSTTIHGTSRPFPYENNILVGFADGHLSALSLEEGQVFWDQNLGVGTKFVDVDIAPLVVNQLIYVNSFSGPLTVLRANNGTTVYKYSFTASRSPLYDEEKGEFTAGSPKGMLYRLDQSHNVLRERKLTEGGITAMVIWKKMLVVATTVGEIYFLDPLTFQTLDTLSLGNKDSSVFGFMDTSEGRLAFYSSRNRLYILE